MPWHLTTREYTASIRDRLRPGGVYTINIVDYASRGFLRAEIATLRDVFEHVAAIGRPGSFGPEEPGIGGNYVVFASDQPLDTDRLGQINRNRARVDDVLSGPEIDAFNDGADVLTDDHAPEDQLLTPYPQP